MIDVGQGVIIRYAFSGRGRMSGAATSKTIGYVIHFSPRGKVGVQEMYWEWTEALEAAGLSE